MLLDASKTAALHTAHSIHVCPAFLFVFSCLVQFMCMCVRSALLRVGAFLDPVTYVVSCQYVSMYPDPWLFISSPPLAPRSGDVFGDFEDVEAGLKFNGDDAATAAAQKAIAEATVRGGEGRSGTGREKMDCKKRMGQGMLGQGRDRS